MAESSQPPAADVEQLLGLDPGARRRRRARRWLALALLAVMATTGIWWWAGSDGRAQRQAEWRTDPAANGDIVVIVTATGTVEPTNRVEVSSELSGIIRSVAVDFNARVTRGQPLAELDTDRLEATLASSRARVQSAGAHIVDGRHRDPDKGRAGSQTDRAGRARAGVLARDRRVACRV
ncbi:MAG: biotin/lipoyl-binding protein [Burkholderiaceae bacterium]